MYLYVMCIFTILISCQRSAIKKSTTVDNYFRYTIYSLFMTFISILHLELEDEVTKAEAEKAKRDHSIRGLNDEINSQEDAIQKLNKEKKFFQENTSRADEELQTANDKLQHLNMVKNKLEQTLDDLEDTLDR